MARIRTIKPEFPQSESMGRISREARLCFIMLWTIADDAGRLRGNSRMLASLLYPYDDDAGTLMEGWLSELAEEECICRYERDGNQYVQINKWLIHQKIDKPSQSKIPQFDESSRLIENPREPSATDLGPVPSTSTKEEEDIRSSHDEHAFDQFWFVCPKKVGKGQARKAHKAACKKTSPEELVRAMSTYAQRVADQDPQFIAHPATWLNGERWLDQDMPKAVDRQQAQIQAFLASIPDDNPQH